MPVHLLHHGRCFDGAVSAALFADFFRGQVDPKASFDAIAKHHRTGDPYDPGDFGPDVNVVVDFRYTQHAGLDWYFDHHRSAFQLPGDREHFDAAAADAGAHRFHDAGEPSCAQFMVEVLRDRHGYDASAHAELIDWATRIDSADFESPEVPVLYEVPAMKLAAYVQTNDDPAAIRAFVEDLTLHSMADLADAPHVRRVVDERLASHREDVALIRKRLQIEDGVLFYDLLAEQPRILSHFIPYYHHPKITYVVGIYRHVDGDLRLTVGYNPWIPKEGRRHDLAAMCEQFGGGGHAYVAGLSLPLGAEDELRKAAASMLATLRS